MIPEQKAKAFVLAKATGSGAEEPFLLEVMLPLLVILGEGCLDGKLS